MKLTAIGLMSGTSMDGIDAALLETDGLAYVHPQQHVAIKYDPEFQLLLKAAEWAVSNSKGCLRTADIAFDHYLQEYLTQELALTDPNSVLKQLKHYFLSCGYALITLSALIERLNFLHVQAVQQLLASTGLTAEQIDVIGYHGQTLFHQPVAGITVQVGDGNYLAKHTHICVVNDFRANDVKHGGQGAPFAPVYHQALVVRDNLTPAVVVNCGGISNITAISGADHDQLLGFDVGPGNGLIDRFVKQRTAGREQMDEDGKYGQRGRVHTEIVQLLYQQACHLQGQNFFTQAPPKSLDIRDFRLVPELAALSLEDGCATLEAFTAFTLVQSIELIKTPHYFNTWILAGGGWHNPVILTQLRQQLATRYGATVKVYQASQLGWNSQALEAELFGFLAVRCLRRLPISFPTTTAVIKPLSGGVISLPTQAYSSKVHQLISTQP